MIYVGGMFVGQTVLAKIITERTLFPLILHSKLKKIVFIFSRLDKFDWSK